MNALRRLMSTRAGWGITVLRLVLGVLFFREGSGKLFGWFGGSGFAGTCAYFRQLGIPFPEVNAWMVATVEFSGGLAFLLGFLSRAAALPVAATMVVAILTAHRGGGWSYPALIFASCAALLQAGSGAFSVDRRLSGGS